MFIVMVMMMVVGVLVTIMVMMLMMMVVMMMVKVTILILIPGENMFQPVSSGVKQFVETADSTGLDSKRGNR